MARGRMQLERAMRLMPVQKHRDRHDGDVSEAECHHGITPPRKLGDAGIHHETSPQAIGQYDEVDPQRLCAGVLKPKPLRNGTGLVRPVRARELDPPSRPRWVERPLEPHEGWDVVSGYPHVIVRRYSS